MLFNITDNEYNIPTNETSEVLVQYSENDNPAMGLTHSLTTFVVSTSYYIGFIDHEGALFLAGQLLHLL